MNIANPPGRLFAQEGYLRPIGRPGGMIVNYRIVGQPHMIGAVRVHNVDLAVAVTIAREGDLSVDAARQCLSRHRNA